MPNDQVQGVPEGLVAEPNPDVATPAAPTAAPPAPLAAQVEGVPAGLIAEPNTQPAQAPGFLQQMKEEVAGPGTLLGEAGAALGQFGAGVSKIAHGDVAAGASQALFGNAAPHVMPGSKIEKLIQSVDPTFKGAGTPESQAAFNEASTRILNSPAVNAGDQIDKNQHPVMKAIAEAAQSFTTPQNVAILAGSGGLNMISSAKSLAMANQLLAAGFGAQSIADAYKRFPAIKKAYDDGDGSELLYQMTHALLSGAMAVPAAYAAGGKEMPVVGEPEKAVAGAVAAAPGKVAEVAGRAVERVKALGKEPLPRTPEELAARATQATGSDVPVAARALSTVLPQAKGAQTFEDLAKVLDTKVKQNTGLVDRELALHQDKYNPYELDRVIQVPGGGEPITANPVTDALDQLEKFYDKTGSQDDVARIRGVQNQYLNDGLSPKEINDIAREHGQALTGFSPSGELSTGLTKQNAENTRSGVKDIVHDLTNDSIKDVDKQTSDLITARGLVQDMQEKVEKLQNKLQPPSTLKKITGGIAKVVDVGTLGLGRALFKEFMGKGEAADRSLSPVDLEKQLPRILDRLDELNKMTPQQAAQSLRTILPKGLPAKAAPTEEEESVNPPSGGSATTGLPYKEPHIEFDDLPRGMDTKAVLNHELAHAAVAKNEGFAPIDVISNTHPEIGSKSSVATTRLDWGKDLQPDKDGTVATAKIKARLDSVLTTAMAGAAANELYDGIPYEQNEGLHGDLELARGILKDLGYSADETEAKLRASVDRAKEYLQHSGTSDIINAASDTREPNLPDTHHYSAGRLRTILQQIEEARNEGNAAGNAKGVEQLGEANVAGREKASAAAVGLQAAGKTAEQVETKPASKLSVDDVNTGGRWFINPDGSAVGATGDWRAEHQQALDSGLVHSSAVRVVDQDTFDISSRPTEEQLSQIARLHKEGGRRLMTYELYPSDGYVVSKEGTIGDMQRDIDKTWPAAGLQAAGKAKAEPKVTLEEALKGSIAENTASAKLTNAAGKELGHVWIDYAPKAEDIADGRTAEINHAILDREYQGKGFGKKMYEAVINSARDRGLSRVVSDTDLSPDAERVWKSLSSQYPVQKLGERYSIELEPAEVKVPPERTTGSVDADKAIKLGGAVPGGTMLNLGMFHDPKTGSTLALPLEGITPEKVAQQLQESRAKFGVKEEPTDVTLRNAANALNESHGRPPVNPAHVGEDPRSAQVADAYKNAVHSPNDPAVKASYDALKRDIDEQYDLAKRMGIRMDVKDENPYGLSTETPAHEELHNDILNNKHLSVWSGGAPPADHPLSEVDPKTGLTYNEKFRMVHDIFGHAVERTDFTPAGEESAWNLHRQMFSPEALPALATETKGQAAYTYKYGDFPPQKAAILPKEFQVRPEEVKPVNAFERAAQHYGTTEDINKAGFIGPDGRMLDFSDGQKSRVLDHGDIGQITPGSNPRVEFTGETGAIRVLHSPRAGVSIQFDIEHPPTAEQLDRLEPLLKDGQTVNVDVGDRIGRRDIVGGAIEKGVASREDLERVIRDAQTDANKSHWSTKVVRGIAEGTDPAGAIDPSTGSTRSKRYGFEVYPEVREKLDHVPTAQDFRDFANRNRELLDKHPELRVGWDTTGDQPEINVGVSTDNLDAAKSAAGKLDQRDIWDTVKQEPIHIGGANEQTEFKDYPLEDRLAEINKPATKLGDLATEKERKNDVGAMLDRARKSLGDAAVHPITEPYIHKYGDGEAWITPDGKTSVDIAEDRDHSGLAHDMMMDTSGEALESEPARKQMMKDGWVRKNGPNDYEIEAINPKSIDTIENAAIANGAFGKEIRIDTPNPNFESGAAGPGRNKRVDTVTIPEGWESIDKEIRKQGKYAAEGSRLGDLMVKKQRAEDTTTMRPKGSTVELMSNPLKVKASGISEKPSTVDVARVDEVHQ